MAKRTEGHIELPRGSIPSPSGGKSDALDFSQALLQGHPVATEALRRAMSKGEEEASFADRFMASTYTFSKRTKMPAGPAKVIDAALAMYREDMRRAHRFVLDDDFVRYATEISSAIPPAKLLARLQYATLPYETTWIEHNLPVKVRTMHRVHGTSDQAFDWSSVGSKLGLLLYRINETDAVCQIVCEQHDREEVVPTLIAFFFSLRETAFPVRTHPMSGCRPLTGPGNDVAKELQDPDLGARIVNSVGRASLWGYTDQGHSTMLTAMGQLTGLGVPDFLQRHGELGTSRLYPLFMGMGRDNKLLAKILLQETTEFAGMMRWVVVVLAMLNEVPIHAGLVTPQGRIRIGLTQKRKFMDYHRVTLKLPKTNPVQWIEKKFHEANRRHRAHEVRAFWRTYLNATHCRLDEHKWEYDYDNGYALCGKCFAYRRHIHEHIRGDASLGWVRKDYVVKKGGL